MTILLLSVGSANAQEIYNSSGRKVPKKPEKEKGFNRDLLVVGGDFRFTAGTGFLSAGVAPMLGYQVFNNFFGGVKLGYSYDRVRVSPNALPAGSSNNVLNFSAISPSVWARYLILESFYLHAELEYNFFNSYVWELDQTNFTEVLVNKRIESPSVMVGIGFRQPISDRTSLNTTFLYDVLGRTNSYYELMGKGGIDFRIGILVGF